MRSMWILALALAGCPAAEPAAVPPPSSDLVGTWKSRDDTIRLVLAGDGRIQYTRGRWTNTGLVVGWNDVGFEVSAYPKPEQHAVTEQPHEKEGYTWITVDDAELYRTSTEAVIGVPAPPKKEGAPAAEPVAPR